MKPQYNEFPEFVPDQLLMSDHLNQVFNYLDEQERMTRSCLIGVGIVCGLEVNTNNNGSAVTIAITEGCGITTEGFLVQVPAMAYTEYVPYDPVKARYYDRFVDLGTKQKKFDLFELVQSGVVEASVPLTDAFIADKVVLLFVELLEEQSKNCDPNSCDDKGIEVTVTFRPLLVSKTDAAALKAGAGGGAKLGNDVLNLQEMRMPRVDVPATSLVDSAAVFDAFLLPFTDKFLETVEKLLSKTYLLLKDLVVDVYPANPFANLAHDFRFLVTRIMTAEQLMHAQYYYDLFSDLLLSYEELRRVGGCVAGVCCPADDFPRHLLLGEAKGYNPYVHSDYRHYFIPSPILAKQPCLLAELRSIEIRLALLVTRFLVPNVQKAGGKLSAEFIGITPSSLGDVPLSKKAIPYYYAVIKTPNPLYTYWDRSKTRADAANKNLSYHATEYNSSDDMIRRPLLYDLEPYNFLRIEGHVGQSYVDSLASIQLQRSKYRLPIEVIALSTDMRGLLAELGGSMTKDVTAISRAGCHFRDLESLYAALEKHLICFLCKEMKYYYALPNSEAAPGAATLVPKVALLQKCDPAFRYAPNTYGQDFEDWFAGMNKMPYTPVESILSTSGYSSYAPMLARLKAKVIEKPLVEGAVIAAVEKAALPAREVQIVFFNQFMRFILYYIERLSETLTGSLATLDIETFQARFDDLQQAAATYKEVVLRQSDGVTALKTEELLDHLDKLIYACDPSEFRSLAAEFQKRWLAIDALRRLAYYAKKCPSLQHKAGVPMGGTFVLVYHEASSGNTSLRKLEKINFDDRILEGMISGLDAKKGKLDELIRNIPNGTVIADFYFPFICCSDCPPIQFEIVSGTTPAPDAPKISITPTEFCNDNPGPIAITVSPEGGTIGGEGAGSDGDSGFSFVPKKVDVGENSSKEIGLTYTSGGATASVTVKVYHPPTADFKVVQSPSTGPAHVDVTDASTFAESYNWDFGDGTPSVTTQKASHDYKESGKYSITLTVKNGPCTAQKKVSVKIEVARVCLPVKTLTEEFVNLSAVDAPNFSVFRKRFTFFVDVDAFFKDLAAAGDMSQAIELKFYQDHKIITTLAAWLRQLESNIIIELPELRTLALELYRILSGLAMRIACFQDEDINAAKAPTPTIFKLIISAVNEWTKIAPNTVAAAKQRIKMLASDVQSEFDRLKADEKSDKPNYASALNELIKALKAYPF